MIENFSALDFVSLDEFPLKWRWKDKKWNEFSKKALDEIRPLKPIRANEIFEASLHFCDDNGLITDKFSNIESLETLENREQVVQWLTSRIASKTDIIISWDERMAIVTESNVFCAAWDDFCYPSSDDVTIFPKDLKFVLHYSHRENFEFGISWSFARG